MKYDNEWIEGDPTPLSDEPTATVRQALWKPRLLPATEFYMSQHVIVPLHEVRYKADVRVLRNRPMQKTPMKTTAVQLRLVWSEFVDRATNELDIEGVVSTKPRFRVQCPRVVLLRLGVHLIGLNARQMTYLRRILRWDMAKGSGPTHPVVLYREGDPVAALSPVRVAPDIRGELVKPPPTYVPLESVVTTQAGG
jgi:hypothetical protein